MSSASCAGQARTRGNSWWLSAVRAPMPGDVLDHRDARRPPAAPRTQARAQADDLVPGRPRRRGRRSRHARRAARRSSTGAQTTSSPSATQVAPEQRGIGAGGVGSGAPSKAAAAGKASQCGGFSRATRPPSWSTRIGASRAQDVADRRRSARAAAPASATLRANRMTPSGGVARSSAASSAVRAVAGQADDAPARGRPQRVQARRALSG